MAAGLLSSGFAPARIGGRPLFGRRHRNPFRPSEAELRANLAGEASADAALALHEAEAAEPVEQEPAPLRDLTAAAFFDVDNTMVQGASIVHFARGLVARKYLRTQDLVDFAWKQVKFRVTGKESSDDVASGREKALAFVAGRSTAELAQLGEEIYDEIIADRIWTGTRALAQMHLDAGQQVWLVTATPVELAQVIAKRLGLTGALGTVAESKDGVFTGRLVGDILHGVGKAHAVRSLAIREGLNLKRCTAYSDSYNDAPMLSLVGTAVAINPDSDLRELAKNRGWEIRDFRTARKAAKVGVPTALALGAAGGAVAAVLTRRRENLLAS
ncbi:MAG: HAD-IB family hydrolase [Aldersonia sp.]|nr:HAD-IB family hydrolase [Aldersonia sp.]